MGELITIMVLLLLFCSSFQESKYYTQREQIRYSHSRLWHSAATLLQKNLPALGITSVQTIMRDFNKQIEVKTSITVSR